MLCDVTNRSRGPRGLQTEAGTTHLVEPGETVCLDLAEHPLHRAWEAAGEIAIMKITADPSETSSTPHPPELLVAEPRRSDTFFPEGEVGAPLASSRSQRELGRARRMRRSDAIKAT